MPTLTFSVGWHISEPCQGSPPESHACPSDTASWFSQHGCLGPEQAAPSTMVFIKPHVELARV